MGRDTINKEEEGDAACTVCAVDANGINRLRKLTGDTGQNILDEGYINQLEEGYSYVLFFLQIHRPYVCLLGGSGAQCSTK